MATTPPLDFLPKHFNLYKSVSTSPANPPVSGYIALLRNRYIGKLFLLYVVQDVDLRQREKPATSVLYSIE